MTRHLSASSIAAYLDCPARFKATRIDKRPDPKGPPLIVGIAMHEALERFCKRRIDLTRIGIDPDYPRLLANVERDFDRAFAQAVPMVDTWRRETPENAQADGRAATLALAGWLIDIEPAAVEIPFSVPLRDGWTLDGRIDMIDINGNLWDFKSQTGDTTSDWRWSHQKALRERQPGLYGFAEHIRTGRIPDWFSFAVADKTLTSEVDWYQIRLHPIRTHMARLVALVVSYAVERNRFPRAQACRWCPFRTSGGC